MVYAKKQSGDPDFDDKQPVDQHGGKLVTAPDGREVLITDAAGPVDRFTGEHVQIEGPTDTDLDNRPKPGQVAKEPSEVQTFTVKDTPMAPDAPAVGAQQFLQDKRAEKQDADAGAAPKVEAEKADNSGETPSSDGEMAKGVDASPATKPVTSRNTRTK